MLHTSLAYVSLLFIGLPLWKMNSILSVPACFSQPRDRHPIFWRIQLVHTVTSILTRSLYPNIFRVVSQLMWFSVFTTVIVYFSGSMLEMYSVPMCVFIFLSRPF